jgi:hypothetical protein
MIVEPFKPYHVHLLKAQGVQNAQLGEVSLVPDSWDSVPAGPALTARHKDRILICGGIVKHTERRGECWALVGADAGRHMLTLTRAVKRFIDVYPWRRLEATVEERFGAGCRWVELLGFTFESALPQYGLDGETHLRYTRLR